MTQSQDNIVAAIADAINLACKDRPLGRLQDIRVALKSLRRKPGQKVFNIRTIFPTYAFHVGGRAELQFNIGLEDNNLFRHGIAFSLEPSQTLPDINKLIPLVERFNEFTRIRPEFFDTYEMWHYQKGLRGANSRVNAIGPQLIRDKTFIFIGRLQSRDSISLQRILDDFDQLLEVYRFVMGTQPFPELYSRISNYSTHRFTFSPGCTVKASTATTTLPERILNIELRHNDIQIELYNHLIAAHGKELVATEVLTGNEGKIDVAVKVGDHFDLLEIKVGSSARFCIRQGLSQLLEYAFWNNTIPVRRLVIVGEPALDIESANFLSLLRQRFSMPIYYQQFDRENKQLI